MPRDRTPLAGWPHVAVQFSEAGESFECPHCGHVSDYEPFKSSERRPIIARWGMPWCCFECDLYFAIIVPKRGKA